MNAMPSPAAGAPKQTVDALDLDETMNLVQDAAAAIIVAARGLGSREERQAFAALTDLLTTRIGDMADVIGGTDTTEAQS